MASVCIETKPMNKHAREGFRILARIIARDFIEKQSLNGDGKQGGANDENIQDK